MPVGVAFLFVLAKPPDRRAYLGECRHLNLMNSKRFFCSLGKKIRAATAAAAVSAAPLPGGGNLAMSTGARRTGTAGWVFALWIELRRVNLVLAAVALLAAGLHIRAAIWADFTNAG
jgi:hypothetical protein